MREINPKETTREDRFRKPVQARPTISVWRDIFGLDSHSKVSAKSMFTFEKSW